MRQNHTGGSPEKTKPVLGRPTPAKAEQQKTNSAEASLLQEQPEITVFNIASHALCPRV